MKKIIFVILLFSTLIVNAKRYDTGIGLRAGYSYNLNYGLTYNQFLKDDSQWAINLSLFNVSGGDYGLSGLLKYHLKSQSKNRSMSYFNYFVGLGLHDIFINSTNRGTNNDKSTKLGADFDLGLEFNIPKTPFVFALDVKPYYNFTGSKNDFLDAGVTLYYTF